MKGPLKQHDNLQKEDVRYNQEQSTIQEMNDVMKSDGLDCLTYLPWETNRQFTTGIPEKAKTNIKNHGIYIKILIFIWDIWFFFLINSIKIKLLSPNFQNTFTLFFFSRLNSSYINMKKIIVKMEKEVDKKKWGWGEWWAVDVHKVGVSLFQNWKKKGLSAGSEDKKGIGPVTVR